MTSNKVGLVSLGCSKNQVDAQRLLGLLTAAGYEISPHPGECAVVIINTCGFIEAAKQEAIDTILEFAGYKERGLVGKLVVTGCLPERYREELAVLLPEVDAALGIGKNSEVAAAVKAVLAGGKYFAFGEKEKLDLEGERVLTGPVHTAYLKVAEGCENFCSYCAIPLIRGRFRSRSIENILAEARELISAGAVEINLIAQDTTRYGEDIYGRLALPELLRELCALPGLRWLRLLYCYPERITDELLKEVANQPKIVKYIDLPIQHASGKILGEMNRRGDEKSLAGLIAKIRMAIPGVALRTTVIVGFPGEDEADFETLCEFIRAAKFERLGCFTYSQEEDTPAGARTDQIDTEVKDRRSEVVMDIQAGIAYDLAGKQIGKEIEVLCQGHDSEGRLYARSAADAPDIDTKVYLRLPEGSRAPTSGEFVRVLVESAEGYDIVGIVREI